MDSYKTKKPRYGLIDTLRGFSILNMVAYHLCFDIFHIYGFNTLWMYSPAAVVWERFICCSFIIISGISLNFSGRGYRRGLLVSACGALMTVVTLIAVPGFAIWFGVLTCIGASMLITQALRKLLERIHPLIGAAASLLIFAALYGVPDGYAGFFKLRLLELPRFWYQNHFTAFFGFLPKGFVSSDYFPLFPWLFLFIFGFFLWRAVARYKAEGFFKFSIPPLAFTGRHSLLIYIVHQPVLMGICFLIFGYF